MRGNKARIGFRVLSNPSWMGGVNYVLSWVKALNLLPDDEKPEIYFLFFDEGGRRIAEDHSDLVADVRPFSEAHLLDLDLVYPATQIFEAPCEAPWAAWIPDWQCKHMPEMFDDFELARRDLHYRILATKAPFLVVSSQMAYDDTVRIVGNDHVPMDKLPFPAVIDDKYFVPDTESITATLNKFGLPRRFILVCNQFWKHKNHFVVFRALAKLSDPSLICVFTGDTTDHRWPDYIASVKSFISDKGLSSSVYLLGRIDREDQLNLMKEAVAIVQPSRFEGWSTVVEEAKVLNKTLIVSRFPVHIEQAAGNSYFFDPDDADELADLIKKLWSANHERPGVSKEHLQSQNSHLRHCARQFIRIANLTKSNYKAKLHDPKIILFELLRNFQTKGKPTQKELYQRLLAGTRLMFRNQPEQLVKFMTDIYDRDPEFFETAKHEILFPTIFKMSNDDRHLCLEKINMATHGQAKKFSFLAGIKSLVRRANGMKTLIKR